MSDRTDNLIEALVTARESGLQRNDVLDLADDVFDAPWSSDSLTQYYARGPLARELAEAVR